MFVVIAKYALVNLSFSSCMEGIEWSLIGAESSMSHFSYCSLVGANYL